MTFLAYFRFNIRRLVMQRFPDSDMGTAGEASAR